MFSYSFQDYVYMWGLNLPLLIACYLLLMGVGYVISRLGTENIKGRWSRLPSHWLSLSLASILSVFVYTYCIGRVGSLEFTFEVILSGMPVSAEMAREHITYSAISSVLSVLVTISVLDGSH